MGKGWFVVCILYGSAVLESKWFRVTHQVSAARMKTLSSLVSLGTQTLSIYQTQRLKTVWTASKFSILLFHLSQGESRFLYAWKISKQISETQKYHKNFHLVTQNIIKIPLILFQFLATQNYHLLLYSLTQKYHFGFS